MGWLWNEIKQGIQDILEAIFVRSTYTVPITQASMNQPIVVPNVPAPPPQPPMLQRFATCIRDYEGLPPSALNPKGGLNWQLNNPGDCRPSPVGYLPKYGAVEIIDTDTDPRYPYHKGKFAKFPSYELGWEYLLALIVEQTNAHPAWTILDFMNNFSPSSDSNNPNAYAQHIATQLGVEVEYPMLQVISS